MLVAERKHNYDELIGRQYVEEGCPEGIRKKEKPHQKTFSKAKAAKSGYRLGHYYHVWNYWSQNRPYQYC
jgi:hypothetical protein